MTDEPPLLREYLRVSKDHSGEEISPTQQHDEHEAAVTEGLFRLHPHPYRDVGSASRHAKKARTDFDRMMADLEAGRFGADGLALWEASRGSRRVSEWARLIELLAEKHLKVWVHTHGRFYDPTNARDRKTLQEEAVDAEYEAGKTSDRIRRDKAARARRGRPAGRLSYAQVSEYDPHTGRLLRRVWDAEKAKHVIDLFRRVDAGAGLTRMAHEWEAAGIVNGAGKPFTPVHLRDLLRNRNYIGERVHVPGQIIRWWKVPPGEVAITKGDWDPLVDRELFFRVQEILSDPSRVKTRPGGAKHLLTMFTPCDTCDGPMTVLTHKGRQVYRCRKTGCAQVWKDELEAFAEGIILDYLSDRDVYRRLVQAGEDSAVDLKQARAKLAELRAEHRQLIESRKARRISLSAFEELEPGLLHDIEQEAERVDDLEMPPILRGLIKPGADVRQRWHEITDIAIRRKIARAVLIPGRAGQLRILPNPSPGMHAPIRRRVRIHRID